MFSLDSILTNPLSIITFVLQLVLIIHAVRNGRFFPWFYLLMFLPVIGIIAYLVVVILPEQSWSVPDILPKRSPSVKSLEEAVADYPTVTNKEALADAYAKQGLPDQAITLYRQCLTDEVTDYVHIRRKLAWILFEQQRFLEAETEIETILSTQDSRPEDYLLQARILEARGKPADLSYQMAVARSASLEPDYYYIKYLQSRNQDEAAAKKQAAKKYQDLVPKYQSQERKWKKKITSL